MPYAVQVTLDSVAPHPLADWWAQTLGWEVEPSDEAFIRSMIEQGFATEDQTMTHHGVLVWKEGAAIAPADQPQHGLPQRMLFQLSAEPKAGKNRMHLDVRLAGDSIDDVRARLEERGATYLWSANQGPHQWHTMADPEGNEFCLG